MAMEPGTMATPQAATTMAPGTFAVPPTGSMHHGEITGRHHDGTRHQPPPPSWHQSDATGRDNEDTRHQCKASDRDEKGTKHPCGATRFIAMDIVSIASSIQADSSAWTVIAQPWTHVQESNGYCGLRCLMQRTLHGELATVRVHVTVFGDEAADGGLVEKKLASKQSRLEAACRDVFRVLLRKYSVPHFALVPVRALERHGKDGLHRVVIEVHKAGLLQDKLHRCASIASGMFRSQVVKTSFHMSVDHVYVA
jgi:hypothetical protein